MLLLGSSTSLLGPPSASTYVAFNMYNQVIFSDKFFTTPRTGENLLNLAMSDLSMSQQIWLGSVSSRARTALESNAGHLNAACLPCPGLDRAVLS